ncbi:unnamed protein product [Phyllotreta striolata]|uniref:Glycosyltransferase family 92 protein n=1 Tax=Phyllotreta striolata TaxID=444603 RepID=A0A9N9TU05_PHYSR|nr:unnamed protein product [Phyllotreta striolata]
MKKYHQLILLIISAISLGLFLIYRHEYNRLHYVLEVFNFFGQPCNFSDLQTIDFTLRQHDWGPPPVWQETENAYIYSAFLIEKSKAKAIVLPKDGQKLPKNCYLWLEDRKKPLTGKFSFSKMVDGANSLVPYFYYCTATNVETAPFAVSFNSITKHDGNVKKIPLNDISAPKPTVDINITVCVPPLLFSKRKFVEFFSFHRLIGVESFIFYDKDIPRRLVKLMENLSKRLDVRLAFLPWNFPKTETAAVRTIVENDCLLRTLRQSKFTAVLELNEYIVPVSSFTVNDLLRDSKASLPVRKFCSGNGDLGKPVALQSYNVINDARFNSVRYIYKNDNPDGYWDNEAAAPDGSRASVHKYIKCDANTKTTKDYNMMKFSTDFTRSTLVQLLVHNQL